MDSKFKTRPHRIEREADGEVIEQWTVSGVSLERDVAVAVGEFLPGPQSARLASLVDELMEQVELARENGEGRATISPKPACRVTVTWDAPPDIHEQHRRLGHYPDSHPRTDGVEGLKVGHGTDTGWRLREQMDVQLRRVEQTAASVREMMAAPGDYQPEDMKCQTDEIADAARMLSETWDREGMPW
jgi:hypothetical protein